MLYLHAEFGDALASIKNTALWRMRPPVPWSEHLLALATLEPIWSVYTPSSPAYWGTTETHGAFPFSLQFANPLYFLLAVAALAVGIRRRWLNRYEALFMSLLLAIPYCTTSYSCCMAGMGRFVGAMLPLHLVLGNVLARLPAPLAALLLTLSGALMAAYAALFAAGYPIV